MLADLAQQRLAVVVRHPVLGFDEVTGVDARVEALLQRLLVGAQHLLQLGAAFARHRVHRLRIHGTS